MSLDVNLQNEDHHVRRQVSAMTQVNRYQRKYCLTGID